MMDIAEIRLEIVRDLIGIGHYQPNHTKQMIDDAQEIVKYVVSGERYGCDSSDSAKQFNEAEPKLKPLIIPKGTRIKIADCPFYLQEDIDLGMKNEEQHEALAHALYVQENWDTDISLRVGSHAPIQSS